jgi:hypothetical protein
MTKSNRLGAWYVIAVLTAILLNHCNTGEADMRKQLDMLHSVVLLKVMNGGTGSGIVVSSDEEYGTSLVLTAQHVVEGTKPGQIMVKFYPDKEEYPAAIVRMSDMHDMALLRVNHYHPYVTRNIFLTELNIFTPVVSIGAGMGRKPFPKLGIVESYSNSHMHVSAPIIFGDSGGGVFTEIDGEWYLVGMMVAVPMLNPFTPVTHIARCYNIFSIVEFLKKL